MSAIPSRKPDIPHNVVIVAGITLSNASRVALVETEVSGHYRLSFASWHVRHIASSFLAGQFLWPHAVSERSPSQHS